MIGPDYPEGHDLGADPCPCPRFVAAEPTKAEFDAAMDKVRQTPEFQEEYARLVQDEAQPPVECEHTTFASIWPHLMQCQDCRRVYKRSGQTTLFKLVLVDDVLLPADVVAAQEAVVHHVGCGISDGFVDRRNLERLVDWFYTLRVRDETLDYDEAMKFKAASLLAALPKEGE